MQEEKIKPVLNGAAETMLQSFYARAMYSKNPKHRFKDIFKTMLWIFAVHRSCIKALQHSLCCSV